MEYTNIKYKQKSIQQHKKKSSKIIQIPQNIKKYQQILKQCIQNNQSYKFDNFFVCFDVNCIAEIWNKSDQFRKMQILKCLQFRIYGEGQVVYIFKEKKQGDYVFVLLEGQCSYKLQTKKKSRKFVYPTRPGSVLGQFYPLKDSNLDSYSISTQKLSIFLKFPQNSTLKTLLQKKNQNQILQFQSKLYNYAQQNQKIKPSLNLIPYFSTCIYRRNQVIFSTLLKIQYFFYLAEGEIQILKQSVNLNSTIVLVTINEGQFYHFSVQSSKENINQKTQNIFVKCKSASCKIYSIPYEIIKQSNAGNILASINRQNSVSKSLHDKIFSKCQKFLTNPLNALKKRTRKQAKKKRAQSEAEKPWDLVQFFASRMKRNTLIPTRIQRNSLKQSHSVHSTGRQILNSNLIKNLQKLKHDIQQQPILSPQDIQPQNVYPNSFKVKLKSPSNMLPSNFRTITTCPIKQSRNNLLKKTKFKLIRYAKGENFYGINDYF